MDDYHQNNIMMKVFGASRQVETADIVPNCVVHGAVPSSFYLYCCLLYSITLIIKSLTPVGIKVIIIYVPIKP